MRLMELTTQSNYMGQNNTLQVHTGADASLLEVRSDKERFPRLCSYPREQAIYLMLQEVMLAFQMKNQSADRSTLMFIATNLVDELNADYDHLGTKYITFEEIHRVIRKAVLGQAKEMYGLSFASIYAAIVDYIKGEGTEIQNKLCKARSQR